MNIRWDADKYTLDFSFVHEYGSNILGLVDAPDGGTVVDLGCGNGILSKALAEKGYRVIGIDASKELLEIARKHYSEISFFQADATDFTLNEFVDAVFSNAVFH